MRRKHVCRSHASAVVYLHPSSPKSALLPPWATGTFRLPNSVRGATTHRVLCLPNSAGCCETTGLVSHTPSACRVLMNIVTQRFQVRADGVRGTTQRAVFRGETRVARKKQTLNMHSKLY